MSVGTADLIGYLAGGVSYQRPSEAAMSIKTSLPQVIRRIARQTMLGIGVFAALAFSSPDVRLTVPDESPSGPYYARLERGLVHATDEWVAIAFYRDPACVPASFNLLNFFDFGNIPNIFGCALTVHGFELWKNGPQVDIAPIASKLRGNGAVPIWFVSRSDFARALPGITKTELLGMPSLLQGWATFFDETLHPDGGAEQSMLHIVADGTVPDGRSFQYEAVEAAGILQEVRIEFR